MNMYKYGTVVSKVLQLMFAIFNSSIRRYRLDLFQAFSAFALNLLWVMPVKVNYKDSPNQHDRKTWRLITPEIRSIL